MRKVLPAVLAGTMLLGQAVPAGAEEDSGAEAGREKQETVYTAAYYNSVPALPSEIGGEAVTWPELNADEFTALYETAEVKGIYGDGTEITAYVEVVPENLVYFIDSGTGSDWKRTMAGSSDEGAARTLTLDKDMMVKVQYVKTGEENGSMNWLAVAEGETPAPVLNRSELRKAVSSAEEIEPDLDQYASISQNTFSRALETAHRALEDDSYTQGQVNAAADLLNAALDAMVVRDENPNRYTTVPVGKTWLDTEGAPIQAHGGGFLQQTDTDGTPVYYWVGEDKSHNTSNFNGVNLYSSKDLVNWTYLNTVLAPDITESGLSDNKIERPKLLYNEKTEKYVLWGHWEDKSGYSSSQICVAVCDTVDGNYEFLGHWRPGADSAHRNWRVTDSGAVYDSGEVIEDYSDSSVGGGQVPATLRFIWKITGKTHTLFQRRIT